MEIHKLSVQKAQQLNEEFLDQLILQGVEKMTDDQKAVTNALTAFEEMHFWSGHEPERAKIYATEFELLQPKLKEYLNDK